MSNVIVVIGAGSIGQAIARRVGPVSLVLCGSRISHREFVMARTQAAIFEIINRSSIG